MSFITANSYPSDSATSHVEPNSLKKAKVVGLYRISTCGKTYLLSQLKAKLTKDRFEFIEGSKIIYELIEEGIKAFQNPNRSEKEAWFAERGLRVFQNLDVLEKNLWPNQRDLKVFQSLEESEQVPWRMLAIDKIGAQARASKRVTIVAGHFSFWTEGEVQRKVCTLNDLQTYTHILYLNVAPKEIAQRIQHDNKSHTRYRNYASDDHLRRWQDAEEAELRDICQKNDILFRLIAFSSTLLERSVTVLEDFGLHNEEHNMSCAEKELDDMVKAEGGKLTTMLVMDADKTLAAEDTGKLFWEIREKNDPLKNLFSSQLDYTYNAFRQATLLYEEVANIEEYDVLCKKVASEVHMYSEFISLLQMLAEVQHVGAVIVTCGLKLVWEKALMRENLAEHVKVIGGGRIADGLVVTANVKAALVTRLQNLYRLRVYAFGDGPLDLKMLKEAHEAVIVVGREETRSRSMDAELEEAIENGLHARQVLLPSGVTGISTRLDLIKLPEVRLTAQGFSSSIFDRSGQCNNRHVLKLHVLQDEDGGAAKLLMTPMRNAEVAGPELREAHRNTGRYLATKYLTNLIGLEEFPTKHVLPRPTSGFRLYHEDKTLIAALMRGGEPMASGISDVFPQAMFLHVKENEDLTTERLNGRQTVVVVDSVVDTGKTIVDFVKRIRSLHATIQIVIVAGVVQDKFPSSGGLDGYASLSIVALRLSDTQFKGKGTNDTGNRLFNTTHLD